jgi:hypothetical protein
VNCVVNFLVFLSVGCLDWSFVGCDIIWSYKEIPTFWSSFVPPSLGFKGHFGPENGGSMFLQNLVAPARLHSFTPQKTAVKYTVTKELIFTANIICSIPPATEKSEWK